MEIERDCLTVLICAAESLILAIIHRDTSDILKRLHIPIQFRPSTKSDCGILFSSSILEFFSRESPVQSKDSLALAKHYIEILLKSPFLQSLNERGSMYEELPEFTLLYKTNLAIRSCRPGFLNVICLKKCSDAEEQTTLKGECFPRLSKPLSPDKISVKPIGVIRSCFKTKYAVPRQGSLVPTSKGVVELNREVDCSFLDGLQDFSHCWLVWLFHLAHSFGLKGKIRLPKLYGERRGVFSTRSPHRPFPVGLSVVKIERVDLHRIVVSGLDIVDGTPLLDIKPYHPLDQVPLCKFPDWLPKASPSLKVEVPPDVYVFFKSLVEKLQTGRKGLRILKYGGTYPFSFFSDPEDFMTTLINLLALDPRTTQQVNDTQRKMHTCFLDNFTIYYSVHDEKSTVSIHDIVYNLQK